MKLCQPWEEGGCPLADVCDAGSVGAVFGRAAIRNDMYCDIDREGEVCGPVTAYYEAALCANTLRELDENHPWTHNVKIVEVPAGEAPLEVRESLLGLHIPLRSTLQPEDGQVVSIHPLDFILTLDKAGKLKEAQWYRQYTAQLQTEHEQQLEAWYFGTAEVEVSEFNGNRSLLEEYGLLIWQQPFLGSAWTGFVLEPALFTRRGDSDGDKLFGRLREVAEDEHRGDVSVAIARRVVAATFEHNNLMAVVERGPGRLTEVDASGDLLRVVDKGGVVIYDRELGIDERETPENAVSRTPHFPAEEPFVSLAPNKPVRLDTYFDK